AFRPADAVLAEGQLNFAENLGAIRAWPDDEELAVFRADIDLSVGHYRWRLLRGAERLGPELFARFDVVGLQPGPVFDLIEPRAVDDGRREAKLIAEVRP